jgi:predicted nuclease with TOPRIM domain
MSYPSDSSSDDELSFTDEMLDLLIAETKAETAASKLRMANLQQEQSQLEEKRRALYPGVKFPTFKEMEASVLQSGAYWVALEAQNSVVDLHKQCMAASRPYDLESFVHPGLHDPPLPSHSKNT